MTGEVFIVDKNSQKHLNESRAERKSRVARTISWEQKKIAERENCVSGKINKLAITRKQSCCGGE